MGVKVDPSTFLRIDKAKPFFCNFDGRQNPYTMEGDRNISILLDPEMADNLRSKGWNVKYIEPRVSEDERKAYLLIHLPKNYPATSYETDEIDSVDVVIIPYEWTIRDKYGIKAYLYSMTVREKADG